MLKNWLKSNIEGVTWGDGWGEGRISVSSTTASGELDLWVPVLS